jgi:serine protease Do
MAAMNQTTDAGAIGYATPIDIAREVATQLIANGSVTKAWLGVQGRTVAASRAKDLGVDGGAVVQTVNAGGPAADAGLMPADLIVELDGQAVGSMAALAVLMRGHRPGDTVTLGLIRAGQRHAVQVKLVAPPSAS